MWGVLKYTSEILSPLNCILTLLACFEGLLVWVLDVLACLYAGRARVLMCSLAYVLAYLRAYVLTCSCAYIFIYNYFFSSVYLNFTYMKYVILFFPYFDWAWNSSIHENIEIYNYNYKIIILIYTLTHSFPVHPFSNHWKPYGFLMFSGARERVHWEQMG